MDLMIVEDDSSLGEAAAELVIGMISAQPALRVTFPVGETPESTYRALAAASREGRVDATHLRIFQLDEYLGLPEGDPRTLYGWLRRDLLDPLHLSDTQIVRLPSGTENPDETCRQYDRTLAEAGGLDLAVLGLGPNGHLGFNEPPIEPDAPTRVVTLTPASIASNARYWGSVEQVPRRAITCGMRNLLAARHVLLLVSGQHKREILRSTLRGPVSPDVPSSFLQRAPRVTVLADRAAADGLDTE